MKSIEALLPQDAVPAQPFIDLGERLGPKRVDPPLSFLPDVDEPRLERASPADPSRVACEIRPYRASRTCERGATVSGRSSLRLKLLARER
jgi:hypothetical protein